MTTTRAASMVSGVVGRPCDFAWGRPVVASKTAIGETISERLAASMAARVILSVGFARKDGDDGRCVEKHQSPTRVEERFAVELGVG